jgi:hypothetical protein
MPRCWIFSLRPKPDSSRRGRWNYDFADDAETTGYDFVFTRSLARALLKYERPLGTPWHPERPLSKNPGSLREELELSDVVSGSFRKIREIAAPWAAAR